MRCVCKTFAILTCFAAAAIASAQQRGSGTPASPPTLVTASPASLQIVGNVTVNKRAVNETTSTIFAGDRIETASSAVVRISAPGLALYMPENSCLTYSGQQ